MERAKDTILTKKDKNFHLKCIKKIEFEYTKKK